MGWGKGRGFGPGPFGHHHHHHRGPGLGVVAAEAAVVGAVAGAAIATVAATSHPRPKPRPKPYYRGPEVVVVNTGRPIVPVAQAQPLPVAQAQPVVVVSPYPKRKGKGRGKGKGKVPIVVDTTPPLSIASISMQLPLAEIRGITYFFSIDVTPESGSPWRVKRCYAEFEELFFKLGKQSFPAASFPQKLDKMTRGDSRYDFGIGLGTCSHCKSKCKNRGDRETRRVYCTDCYANRFPDAEVLQMHHRQLESWLQSVIQHPCSRGPWAYPLRGFLEAGREVISTATPAYTAPPTTPAPMPSAPPTTPAPMPCPTEASMEEHDEQGEMMSIEIPSGVSAGQVIAITVPNGRQVQFTVPVGQTGGDVVNLWYDATAGTLTPVQDSEEQPEADQTLSIEIPVGIKSGQLIAITVPDGRQIEFTVPETKTGGDQLDLWFDSTAGTLTPLL